MLFIYVQITNNYNLFIEHRFITIIKCKQEHVLKLICVHGINCTDLSITTTLL